MAQNKFRLMEYIATIGVNNELNEKIKQMNGDLSSIVKLQLEGCVLSRFPLEDHKDFPFSDGIVNFCLPNGWYIETTPKRPLFYSVTLTDIDGVYSYAAYIVWNQYVGRCKSDNVHEVDIYVPKCICVVSRLFYFDMLKECLLTVFDELWNHNVLDSSKDKYLAEKVVSALISSPKIFGPGLESYKLPLYDKYYINIHSPLTNRFNSTGDDVFFLAKHLGVHNLVRLYNVLLLDNKILFVSSSYNFLFKACNGLVSLLYPLKFNYVYIPLLPKSLIDIVNAPTPFMIGMHASSFESFCSAGVLPNEVVVVNLDIGCIKINSEHPVPCFSDRLINFLEVGLSNILYLELTQPDELFCKPKQMCDKEKDKRIRAYFLIFLVQMFQDYLSCTNIIRVHPKILIQFQKFLDTMIFNQFISERGVPYRECDIFDDLMMRYNNEVAENKDTLDLTSLINTAWSTFMENERIDETELNENQPSSCLPHVEFYDESSFAKINVRDIKFEKVKFTVNQPDRSKLIYSSKALAKMATSPAFIPLDINSYRFGLTFTISKFHSKIVKEFVRYIFEGECLRAFQMTKKVKSLRDQPGIRVLLCNELSSRAKQNCNQLDCDQFGVLSEVLNSYLDTENDDYCFIMSSLVVEIANNFYKKNKDNIVFIFTQLQRHKAWGFLPFWESLFYVSAQSQLTDLYLHDKTLASILPVFKKENYSSYYLNEYKNNKEDINQQCDSKKPNYETVFHSTYYEVSTAPPVIVDQLKKLDQLSTANMEVIEKLEDDILFSLTNLFVSQIIYMNMQMKEAARYLKSINHDGKMDNTDRSNISSATTGDVSKLAFRKETVILKTDALVEHKLISELIQRFISKVFVALNFKFESSAHITSRTVEIMKFHCEALERIHLEKDSKLKDIKEIVKAPLITSTERVNSMYSCVMFPEGLVNDINIQKINLPTILPAVGIVFITHYRLYFFGYSINRYTSKCIISRSVPFGLIKSCKAAEHGYFPSIFKNELTISQVILILLKSGGKVIFGLLPENGIDKNELFTKFISKRNIELISKLNKNKVIDSLEECDSHSTMVSRSFPDTDDKLGLGKMSVSSQTILDGRDSVASNVDLDSINVFESVSSEAQKKLKINKFKSIKTKIKGLKKTATDKIKSTIKVDAGARFLKKTSKPKQKAMVTDFNALYTKMFEKDSNGTNTEESVTEKIAVQSLYIADYSRRMRILICNCSLSSNIFSKDDWRLTLMNTKKTIVTLPQIFPVCFQITDEIILKLNKYFKSKRIPILTWTLTKPTAVINTSSHECNYYPGALLRCSSVLKSLNLFGHKISANSSTSKSNVNNNLNELDIGMSSKVKVLQTNPPRQSTLDRNRSNKHQEDENYLDLLDRLRRPHMLFITDTQEAYDVNDVSCHFSDLYIFGDKSFNKGVSDDKKLSIFNLDMPDPTHIESAFTKLIKSISSNKPEDITQLSYMIPMSKSLWFNYIKKIIKLSASVTFSIEYGEAFSVVGFGDGSKTSAQVSSLVQVLLDPYYRTIDGFQTLVEKEWLAFRHNFIILNGISTGSQSVFYPIFLQFLDCVHQILLQFPYAFEFNDYFLKFLAYHHLSNKFDTFLTCSTDSFSTENQRIEHSDNSAELFSARSFDNLCVSPASNSVDQISLSKTTVNEEKFPEESSIDFSLNEEDNYRIVSNDRETSVPTLTTPSSAPMMESSMDSLSCKSNYFMKETIWSYINRYREKIPIFYNTEYVQGMYSVLYPGYHMALIDLWEYYYEVPQLMNPSNYELEYIYRNLFVNSDAVYPYETYCSNNGANYSGRPFEEVGVINVDGKANKTDTKNFTFYSGAAYLGYILESPFVIDRFNHTINNYLISNPDGTKLSSLLNFSNINVSNKMLRVLNEGTNDEHNVYELLHSNYFSIIYTKRFFISLVAKDKSFYSKTMLANSDHYFIQIVHDFVEAPPSDHLTCMYCSKVLSGKYNYYTCQKCHLNIHIKCSKQISQICNMGNVPTTNTIDSSEDHTRVKTLPKIYLGMFRTKEKNTTNSLSNETELKEQRQSKRKFCASVPSGDSFLRWSAISTTSKTSTLTLSPSTTSVQKQGYLYSGNKQTTYHKRYYVIDNKDQKLLVYDKNSALPNSVILDEYLLSDFLNCTVVKIDSNQNEKTNDDADRDNSKDSDHSYLRVKSITNNSIYLEIKFISNVKPLQLRDKTDDLTRNWLLSFSKHVQE